MSWVRRASFLATALFLGALAVFVICGHEHTGLAETLKEIARYMNLTVLALVGFIFLLLLTVWMPAPAPPSRRHLHWVILGLLYGVWLIVPGAFILLSMGGGGGLEGGVCGTGLDGWAYDLAGPNADPRVEYLDWPPLSHRCVIDGPMGHFEQVFPTAWSWAGFFALVLLPPACFRLARRLTREEVSVARRSYA